MVVVEKKKKEKRSNLKEEKGGVTLLYFTPQRKYEDERGSMPTKWTGLQMAGDPSTMSKQVYEGNIILPIMGE